MRHTTFFIGFSLTLTEGSRVSPSFFKDSLTCQDSFLQQARSVLLCNWATRLDFMIFLVTKKRRKAASTCRAAFFLKKYIGLLPLIVSFTRRAFINKSCFLVKNMGVFSRRPLFYSQNFQAYE